MTEEKTKELKDQINALIEQLPFVDRGEYEVFMMSVDLQTEISELVKRKNVAGTAATIDSMLDTALKKQKSLEQLITLNQSIKRIWGNLTSDQKAVIEMKGAGIRRVMANKKNKIIDDAIKSANETDSPDAGENTPDLQQAAGNEPVIS